MHCLLFLEFIGTTELLVVLLVALVVFGPRKLPELGRALGRALHQLQAASDDFKRTWETESRVDVGVRSKPPRPRAPEALQEGLAAERLSQES
jgi:TatA/E family protein of Tat protein translocase